METLRNWISVEDRLPETPDDIVDVLMSMGTNVRDGCFIKHEDDEEGKFYWSTSNQMHNVTEYVTHWMPLPKSATK